LYVSPYIVIVIRSWRTGWPRHVACVGEMRNTYKILVRKPEGKRPHGRSRWEDLMGIEWEDVDWMHLA